MLNKLLTQTYSNRFNNTVELFVDTGQIGDTLDVSLLTFMANLTLVTLTVIMFMLKHQHRYI